MSKNNGSYPHIVSLLIACNTYDLRYALVHLIPIPMVKSDSYFKQLLLVQLLHKHCKCFSAKEISQDLLESKQNLHRYINEYCSSKGGEGLWRVCRYFPLRLLEMASLSLQSYRLVSLLMHCKKRIVRRVFFIERLEI